MADNGTEAAANEHLLQTATRSPYRKRITDPHFAEVVEWVALADQLSFESAIEIESELRSGHRSRQRASMNRSVSTPPYKLAAPICKMHEITLTG